MMKNQYKNIVDTLSKDLLAEIDREFIERLNPPHTKYNIGDIVYASKLEQHYLIEDITHESFKGWVYKFKIIETGELGDDLIKYADVAKNFHKVA